jgi:hypothetical protein
VGFRRRRDEEVRQFDVLGPRDIREAGGYERDIGVDRQDAIGKIPNNPVAERRISARLIFRISPEFQDSGLQLRQRNNAREYVCAVAAQPGNQPRVKPMPPRVEQRHDVRIEEKHSATRRQFLVPPKIDPERSGLLE